MSTLSRIGIAIEPDLLTRFDRLSKQRGYTNRSEAFRDLIRNQLVEERTATTDARVVGSVTLIYDHHAAGLPDKLMDLQHEFHELVVSTTHAHLDHDSCLEVIILSGPSNVVEQFASRLIGLKGVVHGKLVKSIPAAELSAPAKKKNAEKQTHSHNHKH
jgi:CopG family nickel-responsive transcriptional regulator